MVSNILDIKLVMLIVGLRFKDSSLGVLITLNNTIMSIPCRYPSRRGIVNIIFVYRVPARRKQIRKYFENIKRMKDHVLDMFCLLQVLYPSRRR